MVVTPTSSETWAPCRTRLYTSRPNSSVPSRFRALGAFRRSAGLSRRGSCVETTSANSAARITTAKMPAPRTMLRFLAKRPISLIADPRIDDHVERVDRQVDEDVSGGGHQNHALHHGIVATQD